jgi:cyclopropane fatty-acyl-phospholipid synthase-like methyltransferase
LKHIREVSFYTLVRRTYRKLPLTVREGPLRRVKALALQYLRHDEYDADFFAFVDKTASESAGTIASSIVRDLAPCRAIDVGCGTGALMTALRERGVRVTGLEYSERGLARCRERGLEVHCVDLTRGALPPLQRPYDAVISMEVAEHLPGSVADQFVVTLASLGDSVVFTAATPGQGGTNHVNEQPHAYWIEKFASRGFALDRDTSADWKAAWEVAGVSWWYSRNVMLFRRA